MPESSYRRYYAQSEFLAMNTVPVNPAQLLMHLSTVPFAAPVIDVYDVGGHSIALVWAEYASPADIALADAEVGAYVEIGATDAPLEIESLGITSATTSTPVTVIDVTTPPRAAGTYQISWTALVGMEATVGGTGVRGVISLTRTQGASVVTRTWEHNSALQQPQTFSGAITFECAEGAMLRAHLQVAKVGVPVATAQMAVARITADKIG